jgi:hypothetical protein
MSFIFQISYLTVLAGAVVTGAYAMCRSQQVCLDSSLREALVWGGCFVLSAGVDYLMLVPRADYLIAAT